MEIQSNEEYHEALAEYQTVKEAFKGTPEFSRALELEDAMGAWELKNLPNTHQEGDNDYFGGSK